MKDYLAKEALTKDKPMLKMVEFKSNHNRDDIFFRLIMTEHSTPNCCFDSEGFRNYDYSTKVISSRATSKCLEYSTNDAKAVYDNLKEFRDRDFNFKDKELSGGHYFKNLDDIIKHLDKIIKKNGDGRLYLDEPFEIFAARIEIIKKMEDINSLNNDVNICEKKIMENEKELNLFKEIDSRPIHRELFVLEDKEWKKYFEKINGPELFDEYWKSDKNKYKNFFNQSYFDSHKNIISEFLTVVNKKKEKVNNLEKEIKESQIKIDNYTPVPYESEATGVLRKILLQELKSYLLKK